MITNSLQESLLPTTLNTHSFSHISGYHDILIDTYSIIWFDSISLMDSQRRSIDSQKRVSSFYMMNEIKWKNNSICHSKGVKSKWFWLLSIEQILDSGFWILDSEFWIQFNNEFKKRIDLLIDSMISIEYRIDYRID